MLGTPISNPASFHAEARYQRVCQRRECGKAGAFHAHHVVSKERLRQNGVPEKDRYDTRNALRLCTTCHMQFEWAGPGKLQVATTELTLENICYIWEIFGEAGQDFLEREYTGPDERWWTHVRGECACQRP